MKRKKSIAGRLGTIAVGLSLITTCLMGGTLAKYTTEVSGTGTADVAAWNIEFKEGTDVMTGTAHTFALTDTSSNKNNVTVNKIAPGSSGSFTLYIDGTGTEVAFDYEIAIDKTNLTKGDKVIPIVFYSDSAMINEVDAGFLKGSVALADVGKPVQKDIYWKWVSTDGTDDSKDTAIGEAEAKAEGAMKGTFKVTLTATQKITTS